VTDFEVIRAGDIFSTQQPQGSLCEVDSKA